MPRFPEALSPLERLSLVDMSYSRISNYHDFCHLKYFLSSIIQEPQVFGAAGVMGNILHSTLEDHVGTELELDEMIKSFDFYKEEKDPEGMIGTQLEYDGLNMLTEFYDRHSNDSFDIIAAEQYFEIVIGNTLMRGYIDLIERVDDTTILIRDWKSGKRAVPYAQIESNLQLIIYTLACSMLYPEVNTFQTQLYYLRTGQQRGHVFQRSDLADLELKVVKAVWEMLEDKHHHPTQKTYVCSFCDHAATGACTLGVMRNKERANR